MEKDLVAYKNEALEIFQKIGKLHAVVFLMGKRSARQQLYIGLKNCKDMLEAWIEEKDYVPDAAKLAQYNKVKEERDLLIEALNPFINLAQAVFEDTKKSKEGVLYAFNKAEIKYSDLRRITELITNLKNKQ